MSGLSSNWSLTSLVMIAFNRLVGAGGVYSKDAIESKGEAVADEETGVVWVTRRREYSSARKAAAPSCRLNSCLAVSPSSFMLSISNAYDTTIHPSRECHIVN